MANGHGSWKRADPCDPADRRRQALPHAATRVGRV